MGMGQEPLQEQEMQRLPAMTARSTIHCLNTGHPDVQIIERMGQEGLVTIIRGATPDDYRSKDNDRFVRGVTQEDMEFLVERGVNKDAFLARTFVVHYPLSLKDITEALAAENPHKPLM